MAEASLPLAASGVAQESVQGVEAPPIAVLAHLSPKLSAAFLELWRKRYIKCADLRSAVWDADTKLDSVDQAIKRLRKRLEKTRYQVLKRNGFYIFER